MRKKQIITILIFLCMAFCEDVCAQELTLDKAIRIAQDSSIVAFESKFDYLRQEWAYKTYQSSMEPQISLTAQPMYLHQHFEPTSTAISPSYLNAIGTSVAVTYEQKIEKLGGTVYADSRHIWNELLGDMRSQYGMDRMFGVTPLRVGYRQSLLGYNGFKWEKALEEHNLRHALKEQIYRMQQIAEQTTAYYFEYVSAKEYYDTYHQNYLTTDTLYNIAKKKFMLTTVTREELMSMELERMNAKNQQDNALTELQNARYTLLSYLRIPDTGQELTLLLPDAPQTMLLDAQKAIVMAKANHPDVSALDGQLIEAEQALDVARRKMGLQASLDVSVGVQQYDKNYFKAYGDPKTYAAAMVGLSIPLYDGKLAKNRMRQAEVGMEAVRLAAQEQNRQIEESVITTIKSLETRLRTLPEAAKGQGLADEAFGLIQRRYADGQIDINTYMLAQSRKDQAHTIYTSLLCSFWMSYYKLCRLTMYDFIRQQELSLND